MSDSSRPYSLVVDNATPPVVIVHGGAGSYLAMTTPEQRAARGARLVVAAKAGFEALGQGGARAAVLAAVRCMERDERFNAGRGSRLQSDGVARLSAALMDGRQLRSSAVYNVQGCLYPSELTDALQGRGDRNLDGDGARDLMTELGIPCEDLRTPQNIARWEALRDGVDHVDRDSAIGDAGEQSVRAARDAGVAVPRDLLPPEDQRHGTVGAVALDLAGELWACTSTGGRGHEAVGRVSDTPTPAGNYACAAVGLSATGFGEQILDLNVTGRIATRMLDGASLQEALTRTFDEVTAHRGLLGVIAL
ncbi:MAG: isoaspartyl peptidase/L-asparaginase, partial [Myxococcota bacterium]|nr:isoaspartyl peptidase/L-asparaginase [Myxococcota bacterium]